MFISHTVLYMSILNSCDDELQNFKHTNKLKKKKSNITPPQEKELGSYKRYWEMRTMVAKKGLENIWVVTAK